MENNFSLYADVSWFRDGKVLHSDDVGDYGVAKYHTSAHKDNRSLTIYDTTEEDAGLYNCVAVNPVGELWHEFALTVKRM